LSGKDSEESRVIWEGSPWIAPGLVGVTIESVALAISLTWVELAVLQVGSLYLVGATYLLIGLFWLIRAVRLALVRWSNHYALRGSSLEVRSGILGKKIFTLSAAGFSDLEVTRSLTGRILNMGSIVMETNSERDLKLVRLRDPVNVSSMIRQVMTVPMVRVANEAQLR
jgi:membrane protein implicated in regulation of membrane protease activity